MTSDHAHVHCTPNITEEVRVFQKVLYGPVFLLGLVLNLTALRIFYQKRASWTDTHVYMLNLVLADSTLIAFLPFRIYDTFRGLASNHLCALLVLIHYINMYASILTVTAISVQRFIGIKFPFHSRGWGMGSKKQVAVGVCVLIWVTLVVICVIFRKELTPQHRQSCFERDPHPFSFGFILTLGMVGYVVPLLTMLLCSSQTICTLMANKDPHSNEDKRKSVQIVSANLMVFFICYTPFHIAFFLTFYVTTKEPLDCAYLTWVHNFHRVSEWIATTNCCLDAVGYYFSVKAFRKELIPVRVLKESSL